MYSPSLPHLQEQPVITVFSTARLHQHEPAAPPEAPTLNSPCLTSSSSISLPLSLPEFQQLSRLGSRGMEEAFYQSNSQCCEKDKRHKECLPDLQVSSLDLPDFNYWMMSKAKTVWACRGIPCISKVPPSIHSARRWRSPPCKKSGTKGCAQETSGRSGLWEQNNA